MKYSILYMKSKYDGNVVISLTRTFDDTGFERISASTSGNHSATLGADKFKLYKDSYSLIPTLGNTSMRLYWHNKGSVLSFIDLDAHHPMYQYNQQILAFCDAFKGKELLLSGSGTYCTIEVTDDSQIAKINDLFNRLGVPNPVVNAPLANRKKPSDDEPSPPPYSP